MKGWLLCHAGYSCPLCHRACRHYPLCNGQINRHICLLDPFRYLLREWTAHCAYEYWFFLLLLERCKYVHNALFKRVVLEYEPGHDNVDIRIVHKGLYRKTIVICVRGSSDITRIA